MSGAMTPDVWRLTLCGIFLRTPVGLQFVFRSMDTPPPDPYKYGASQSGIPNPDPEGKDPRYNNTTTMGGLDLPNDIKGSDANRRRFYRLNFPRYAEHTRGQNTEGKRNSRARARTRTANNSHQSLPTQTGLSLIPSTIAQPGSIRDHDHEMNATTRHAPNRFPQAAHRPDIWDFYKRWIVTVPDEATHRQPVAFCLEQVLSRTEPIPSLTVLQDLKDNPTLAFDSGIIPDFSMLLHDLSAAEGSYSTFTNGGPSQLDSMHIISAIVRASDRVDPALSVLSAFNVPPTKEGTLKASPHPFETEDPFSPAIPPEDHRKHSGLDYHLSSIITPHGSYTDLHFDHPMLGGIVIGIEGIKIWFTFSLSIAENRVKYAQWMNDKLAESNWVILWAIKNLVGLHVTVARRGDVFIIEPGHLHAVFSVGSPSALMGYDAAYLSHLDIAKDVMLWNISTREFMDPDQLLDAQSKDLPGLETWAALGPQLESEERRKLKRMIKDVVHALCVNDQLEDYGETYQHLRCILYGEAEL